MIEHHLVVFSCAIAADIFRPDPILDSTKGQDVGVTVSKSEIRSKTKIHYRPTWVWRLGPDCVRQQVETRRR